MRGSLKSFAAAAVFLMLSGCDTLTTDNPIGVNDATQTDAQLFGTWKMTAPQAKAEPKEGKAYAFLLPRKDGGLNAVLVGWNRDYSDSGTITLEILTGSAGGFHFLNGTSFVEDGKPDSSTNYWPALYRFDADGSLRLFKISDDGLKIVADAVESHRLAGTVTKHSLVSGDKSEANATMDIAITADQKSLDAYFAVNAGKIFTDPLYTLKRVELP